ncbi:MAG: UDP-2,4-diacetamido-2,4,6-trideoxy-beta-L-altropyranose hydrolase [Alphaproteobacteria bacterium]|nr:UDP-2,4-diacetamido-2,4,6-trideoxy-beta-L-altropyranose hydrolase [Alphaproteobacteria bacterium]
MFEVRKFCVIRADATTQLGGGHIFRCLVLADALAAKGWTCVFATDERSVEIVPHLKDSGHGLLHLNCDEASETNAIKDAFPAGCDLLVVDHYLRDASFETALRSWAGMILVVEDLLDRQHVCDFILDQTHAERSTDKAASASNPIELIGHEFALLRPRFSRRRRTGGLPVRHFPPQRILIQVGASDISGLASPLVSLALKAFPNATLTVLLGSSSKSLPAMRQLSQLYDRQVDLQIDVRNVDELMSQADFMIGAGGSACWEACCMGLPMALVMAAENQQPVIDQLSHAGAAISLGSSEVFNHQGDVALLALTSLDSEKVSAMSANAARICDGLGVYRVLLALQPEIAADDVVVTLRSVRGSDGPLLLSWQSDPSTRRYFRDSTVPDAGTHYRWLANRLASDKGPFCIILCNNKPCGMIRLDRNYERDLSERFAAYEVSLIIAPDQRGKGLATAALRAASRLVDGADLVAHILAQNLSSVSAFTKAGFVPESSDWYRLKAQGDD